ncbi:unnamed protein product [Toxocara canis]|uniref:Copine domain-containing protein n=2 Tax=Toxocara canis TaxID=6265 RepID=A0A183UDK8_TOXCA|nr:unnamed protein product [Toxocara canis]
MLVETRIAILACVCCKCTTCKCIGGASKKKKQKAITSAETSTAPLKPGIPHDPSDEEETYHVRGARHIPKKVYKPILKPPRSRHDSRLGRFSSHERLVAVTHEGGLYAELKSVALETTKSGKPIELKEHHMDCTDANVDEMVTSCRKKVAMKRGFRQLFAAERTDRTGDEEDTNGVEMERKRPVRFFQKLFRPAGSHTSSPGESPRAFRRTSHADEDQYAEIKREMSVPVSPKSVKFQDEVPARRGQSAVPQTFAFSSRTTQQRTTFDHQHTSTATSTTTPLSWQSHQTTTEFGDTQNAVSNEILDTSLSVQQLQMQSTSRDVHRLDASQSMLDEATRELLQLSASPTAASSISYSSTARLTPAADQLQKSASTSSMNKVIRTVDGGVLKLANVFTWDAVRLSENPHQRPISPLERTFVDGDGNPHTTLYLYTDGTKGAPAVRTSVQGKLKMEKIVGADLVNTEHCVSSGWTIKDTVTHYKVKTKLGERTLVMEERKLPNGEEPANDFKMSVYEGDTLKSEQQADIKIPPNLSKAEYLAYLSERLLRDMEKLEQDEKRRKTTTRIEVEVIEDVTKLLKTYVIGELAELQPQVEVELDQAAIDASDEFMSGQQTYEHASDDESSSPPIEKIDKEYIDSLESKVKKEITATDIRLQAEGQHFAGQSQLIRRVYAESEESSGSTAAWRKEPRCANLSAECELNRTEDSSCNDVLVAEPRVFSAQLSLIRERMVGPERRTATYDMHQLGKRFASETTIRRANKINLEDSTEERAETAAPVECYEMEQEGQRFTDDIRMQSTKRYESEDAEEASKRMQVTECELVRKEDCSWNNVVIALPRTEEVKVLIERSKMIQRQAKAAAYDLEQEGQRFEEETTIRRSNKINLEDSTEERAETAAPGECYAMKQEGQRFTDDVRMQSTKRYESEDAEEASKRKQVTECELIRKEDCSWNNVMIALPRTEEVSVLFKRSRMIQRQAKAAAYDLEQEGQRFEGETIIKRIKHFQSAQSTEEPLEEMGVLKIKDQVREPLPGNYEVQLLGQDFRGEGLIKRTRQFLSSESVEEETGGGVTQVGLNKNSSRGQFEATVVISNDLKRPPIRLKETMETRTVGLTASLARRKCDSLEQRAVLMDKNAWTETYSGRELAEKQTNVMIAIQKTEWDGEAKHETLKNMSAGNSERAQGKFHECTEEQAVIVCGLQCFATHTAAAEVVQGEKITQRIRYSTSATEEEHIHTKAFIASSEVATEEARTQRATTNCASAKYSCVETRSATTSIIVCLQNKAATSLMLSADQVRHDIRSSKGHQLTTIAMSEETVHKEFGIRQGSQFGKSEQADLLVQEKPARTVKFHTKSSREETSTSSMALSKGAKMESGAIKLISKGLQKHCATVAEFGDEIENFTVLLRNSGASHEHAAGQWAEPVTGESMDEDRDENVMSRRIRVRVSEDTDMSTNEDLCAAAERCLMRRVTDQAEMYSENLAEVCYLIKVARNEGSANCLVVITIARKQSWRSVPIQSGTRIQMTASSSSAERVISKKDVSDQSREQIKRITFAETGQRSSEQTTIIHIIPIVLSENEMEVQTQRVSFTNDQTVHQASAFQFRNVPIYQAESSNTSLAHRGNFTSVFSDKTCFGTHVGSTELGVLNGVSDSRHSVLHDYEYRFEEERQGTSRIEQRGGVESSSMWNRDEEQQGETQVLANIPSENSSAGSTTSASFERVDRSQDHCSRSTAVSKVLNATRPDDGSSTDADISRSSTMSAACSSSLAHQMYQLRNQRLAMKRHSSRDNGVVEVPTRKAAAMGRTRNISESGSDSTLIEEHERANMSEHEASHSLTKWSAELSAARIAMMQAGVDLETVLLSTPASMFARSAMRSELNNTRQSLNAHRNIAESEFTEDNRSWKDRGFYRSFEYRHHWSSERDIRAVSIEESRPRSMRCSSAERLERLILAQDRLEDSTCMERMQPLDIYESDTANFIRRQKLVEEGKCRDRLRLAEERTEAKRWHDEQIGKIGRDMHRRQQRDLSTSDFRTPTLRTYSSVTSQTENAFKQFGYITTTDTVIHCDQEAKTISERPRTEKAFLDERMESIEKTNSATNVAIIPLVMKRDNAAQTSPIELSERNYVNELVCHAITVERVRPVELSSSFAQTDDIYEGVVSHQFEGIHPSHNIMQKSSTEQTNEQTEELSHTKAQFDTFIRTRAISLRNKNLTGELISARGCALEAIDHPQYIQRKEGFVEVGKLEATKQTSQESRSFAIEEKHSEGMAVKRDAEAASCDIIVKAAVEDKAKKELIEYGDRRSCISGSFQRIDRLDEEESISKKFADATTLHASLGTSASSSEQIAETIELDRTPEVEKEGKALCERKKVLESRSVHAATESTTAFEKSFDFRIEPINADVTVSDKRHCKLYAAHKELGDEKTVLDAAWSTVVRETSAEKYLPATRTDKQHLEALASSEETAIFESTNVKTEDQIFVEQMQPLRESFSVEGRWAINTQRVEDSLQKLPDLESIDKSMTEKQRAEVTQRFLEQGEEESTTEGAFTRLERTQPIATTEEVVKLQRSLAMSLETMNAQEESTSEKIILTKERMSQLQEHRTIHEKNAATISSSMQATTESAVTETVGFCGRLEETSAEEAILSERKQEITSAKVIESSTEEKNYIAGWDTVLREMSTETRLRDFSQIAEMLTTGASEESIVRISPEIEKQQRSGFAIQMRPLCEKCAECRSFEIGEEHHEKVLERIQACATCEHTVCDRWYQPGESAVGEFGSSEIEAVGFFSRITSSKNDSERAEVVNKMARVWHELLEVDASKEEECRNESELALTGQAELRSLLIKEVNRTSDRLSTFASKDETVRCDAELRNPAAECSVISTAIAKNHETVVSKPLRQTDLVAKFMDASYVTVLNDEEIEVSVCEAFKDQVTLSAEASKESEVQIGGLLQMKSLQRSSELSVPITQFATEQHQFSVSEERYEKLIECSQAELEAENVFKDLVRGSSVVRSLVETAEAEANAGILLMRRTVSKKAASAAHTFNISVTLAQSLDTQSARESFSDICLNFSLPSSATEVHDTVTITNAENVALRMEYSKEERTARNVGFKREQSECERAESVLRALNRERMAQKIHESGSDAFEILSEWTTVYRDLEAETALRHALNVKRVVTVIATTEESSHLSEEWTAREAVLEAEYSMPELAFNHCERSFAIESDWLRIRLEKFPQSEDAVKLRKDAHRQLLSAKMHETGQEKLNAIINLQKVSKVRPLLDASERIWADRLTISAEPIRLKCEASESDAMTVENNLRRPSVQSFAECIRVSAVTTQPVDFECEQAGEERTRMLVDIRGKQIAYDASEKTWPLANRGDDVLLETEEYVEDKCALFAQLNSRQLTFANCDLRLAISRKHEPLMLTTEASREEVVLCKGQWEIRPQLEQLFYTLVIGNKGESIVAQVKESEEHLRTIGVQYSQEEHLLSTECRNIEARFGGEYVLTTKASQEECRSASFDLSRRNELESLRVRLQQKSKSLSMLSVNASTTETISSELIYDKVSSSLELTVHKVCPRTAEPIRGRFIETSEVTHTIHAQFKIRESHSLLPVVVKLVNFGGHLSLHSGYAEETVFNGDYSLRKDMCFMTTGSTLKASNRVPGVKLQTACVKEFWAACSETWMRESKHEAAAVLCKRANKGEHCAMKVNESSEVKQSTYLQYSKEQQHLSTEKTVDEALFGGRFHLSTDASEEHERSICRELVADRQCVIHFTKLLVERLTIKKELMLKASSLVAGELTENLKREIDEETTAVVLREKNREQCSYSVKESEEEELTANIYYSKDSQLLISGYIVQLARDGGSFILSTKAITSEEHILDTQLEKDRLTESFVSYTVILMNNELPVLLTTKQSESEVSNISQHLHRDEEKGDTNMSIRAVNRGEPAERRMKEMTVCDEITHCHHKRADSSASIERTLWQKRYGGSVILEALASSELIFATTVSLASKRVSIDGTHITIKTANRLEPTTFSSKSTTAESLEFSCSFNKSFASQTVSQIRKTPNLEAARCSFVESLHVEETTNLQLERNEKKQSNVAILAEKRFGGSVVLSTNSAQECQNNLYETLAARGRETSAFATFMLSAANCTENPVLSTMHSSETTASSLFELNKSSEVHRLDHKRNAPNKGECIVASVSECTKVEENTLLNYMKNAEVVHISEVFAERRYGGSLRLDTCASEDNTVQHEMAIVATEVKSVAVEACRIEKSTTSPVYLYAAAVREESVVANAQLQKSAAFYCASRMWITSRKGDDQIFRVKESTELDEYSNLQMRREEFRGEIESVLKDCRFGGRIELRTSQAEETDVSISQNFMKQQASIEVSIVRKAVNREQPTVQRYHASEEAEVELLSRLECGKIRSAHVAVLQSAPNKESPVWLQTGESVESLMAINISMQRSLDEEVSSCTLREKRYGGVVHLTCVAVTEQYTGEILLSIQKSSAFAQTSLSVRTANKTAPQLLQTNASTETTSVLQTSITSRLEHFSASACRAQALFGGCIAAKFMAAEETIFNAEISYEKQQSDAEFILSRQEIRQESPKLLQTAASQSEQIEVTETEVRRRLTEVHVESAVERAAREITPVSLQTDYASETLIRTDEELRSFEHRHIAEAHAEQSVAVTESDTIVCTAPVHVELRHEEESREELKEEKSEKRVSFAAEVTETTLSMDMSMTVERREAPSIVKKPMKRESRGRRSAFKQNEAPNFIPMRRNSLLMALAMGSPHNIPHFRTLEDVIKGIKRAGLEYSNLIFGIDYTRSNYYQGEKTFDGRNLHELSADEMNPYQQVIEIVGKTLSSFDADGVIPAYGFGDEETTDQGIFNLYDKDDPDAECNGFEGGLFAGAQDIQRENTFHQYVRTDQLRPFDREGGVAVIMAIIKLQAVQIVRTKQSYHILVIVADGQVTNEKINQKAIAAASHYPLSIIMVGVGDGPWNMMTRFDETLPKRMFDNFHFVDFHKVMFNAPNQEASFALNALMEIPDQYKAIKELGLLKHSRRS